MKFNETITPSLLADILSVSKSIISKWTNSGKIQANKDGNFSIYKLTQFEQINSILKTNWDNEIEVKPIREYKSIELFAGAGGLAIGLEKAGLNAILLNEIDSNACKTLKKNRANWNVLQGDIKEIDFSPYKGIDFLSGGFPCQAFSYAGNKLGFEDTRGTLFFEFARAIKETKPKVFLGENVRGLLSHDNGRTIKSIKAVIKELGYTLIDPKVLKAIFFKVPQKRERLFLIGIRNDLLKYGNFSWPNPYFRILTVRDALKKSELYKVDCPESKGQIYPNRKKEILSMVPEGGCWINLPDKVQQEYMKTSYHMGGGKTGMARRLSWSNPSLTLTCAPAQKQTERCHPEFSRPLTVREYARIQTFPDSWDFCGALTSQYKQIGNAVPVNLAYTVGRRIVSLLNSIEQKQNITNISKSILVSDEDSQLSLFDT